MDRITSTHEHALQSCYHAIQKRGLVVDQSKLSDLKTVNATEIQKNLEAIQQDWSLPLSLGPKAGHINLRSNQQLLQLLKDRGFKLKKVPPTKQQRDSGSDDYKESVGKLPLQILFSETNDPNIRRLLTISELITLRNRYIRARLYETTENSETNFLYLSSYNVAGTLTGRRSSNKNVFGFGGNAQNFPKHTSSAELFLSCLVPRRNNIFLFVDQKSAEEWPVAALSQNREALNELEAGINRHRKLAAFIFGVPTESISKGDIQYYLGKKSRHANNYGMQARRMSLSLAAEGFFIDESNCKILLEKVNQYDPSVKQVYHQSIRERISKDRYLRTPFGRERYFMGFRPNSSNNDVFGEAYSYIPQSVVGDNTGFSVLYLENNQSPHTMVVQEGHDSVVQEVLSEPSVIWKALQNTERSFDRVIDFENGFKFKIPVEAQVGYSFNESKNGDCVTLKDISYNSLLDALNELEKKRGPKQDN